MEPDADNFVSKLVWRSRCLQWVEIMGRLATADRSAPAKSGLTGYLWEIRRFPILEPHEEYMLAKRWREHGDLAAAHRLVKSQLRLYVISEGNVGLIQAIQRFEPEKGFRVATYAVWWIRASIQEYVLRSWALVKMGTTANQKKLFFNLRKAKNRISRWHL
jgi:RNA polymerase sigma-32 factor